MADATGQVVVKDRGTREGTVNRGLGGVPFHVALPVAPAAPAGQYVLKVAIRDATSRRETAFTRTLAVKPVELAVVAPRFFYDAERKVPAPAGGAAGQTLYVQLRAIGADRSQGKVELAMSMQLVDPDGKPVLPKPVEAVAQATDAEAVRQAAVISFNAGVLLTRAGQFTLRIILHDRIGNNVAKLEIPVQAAIP